MAAIVAIMPFSAAVEEVSALVETPVVEIPALMDANETALFDLINAARKDPLGVAESLGMKRTEILKNLPELADILTNGLPELTFNDRLYKSAKDHTADMLANNYYAYESLDGRTIDQRLNDAGYTAAASGESLGLIFFNNFMEPGRAATQIFETMYKDELDPGFAGQRNILNPDIEEGGISFQGGIFRFGRFSFNAYMTTCDFGTKAALQDLQLLNLINQARAFPKAVAVVYGETCPEDLDPEGNGMPAIAFNPELYAAAGDHATDMVKNEYVNHVSLDNRTPEMRLEEKGYVFDWMTELIYRMPVYAIYDAESDAAPPVEQNLSCEPVSDFFKFIYQRAIWSFEKQGDRQLFAPEAVDAGVRIVSGQSSVLGDILTDNFLLSVIELAAPAVSSDPSDPDGPRLMGTVFDDVNQNGLYDAGEEISGAVVTVAADSGAGEVGFSEPFSTLVTNPAGGFSINLAPGPYQVRVWVQDEPRQIITLETGAANKWMGIAIEGESDAKDIGD